MSDRFLRATLILTFALALGARFWRIDAPPGDFHPDRQYNTTLLARFFYCRDNPAVPAWMQDVARANREDVVMRNEIPLTEWLAARVGRTLGHECFWPMRSVASLAWVLGGVFLWLTARRFVTGEAAAAGTAFYLLSPFAILLSRSLQPDSLMVMGCLAAVWAACRYDESPTRARLLAAGLVAGVAILLKPGITQFAIWGVFVALSAARLGWRGILHGASLWVFTVLAALPSALYLAGNVIGGDVATVFRQNFVPKFLLAATFWRGWVGTLLAVLGVGGLVLGLGGLGAAVLLRRGRFGALCLGWGAGYAAQCLLTATATSSHDYYHAPAIPLFALGLAALAEPVLRVISRPGAPAAARHLLLPGAIVACFAAGSVRAEWRQDAAKECDIAMWREVGEAVGHSPRTVFLDYCYGRPLCHHGWVSGRWWPQTHNLEYDERFYGVERIPAPERFRRDYAAQNPDYFIVRNIPDYDRQPDLRAFLESHFAARARTGRYLIFDLRSPLH